MPGDAEFVEEVYSASYRRLVGQMFLICGDLVTAEDAVQEAFVRAIARPRSLRNADNPEAWLHRIALNVEASRWRRIRTHRAAVVKLADSSSPSSPELSANHVALLTALQSLPQAQRVAIVLHHLVDLSVDEIARQLSVPTGTVKARLARGRAALSGLLAEQEDRYA